MAQVVNRQRGEVRFLEGFVPCVGASCWIATSLKMPPTILLRSQAREFVRCRRRRGVELRDLGVELSAGFAPLVTPRARHLQQLAHPLDAVGGLLRLDPPGRLLLVVLADEEGRGFFKNSRSKRNSAFSRRKRSNSARSSASSTAPVSPADKAWRWRRTQRPSACSPTPISAAT